MEIGIHMYIHTYICTYIHINIHTNLTISGFVLSILIGKLDLG